MSTPPATTPLGTSGLPPAVPTSMTAVVTRRYGGIDEVEVDQVPTPVPGRGEVLVQVRAASLNPADHHVVTGTPYLVRLLSGLRRPKHVVRGADLAGTVVAVGPGVDDLALGADVFGEAAHGAFGGYAAVPARRLAEKPAGVSFEAAAATPMAGLTALQALRAKAHVQTGERVLVNGGAGGVGTFAVQIARALGAEVTAVCSTRNVERVRALGATHVVDYLTDDVVALGGSFDVMIDNVGNLPPRDRVRLLRPAGRYVAVSGPKTNRWLGPIPDLVRTRLAFVRSGRRFHQFTEAVNRDDLTFLGELMTSGAVVPAVHRTVGLDGVADGLAELLTGHTPAKIVVVVPS